MEFFAMPKLFGYVDSAHNVIPNNYTQTIEDISIWFSMPHGHTSKHFPWISWVCSLQYNWIISVIII